MQLNLPTPIEPIEFEGLSLYLKRDDLIDVHFSGNKARKLYYYLVNDFPDIEKIVSYGSSQSNAMYSLSVLAKIRGWEFEYYVDHIADYLKKNPHGNYKAALDNGMNIIAGEEITPAQTFEDNTLFIQEGGRQKEAEYGIEILAQEIIDWQIKNGIRDLNIFLPSGTGTTALFLQKSMIKMQSQTVSSKVYTCACVGGDEYLQKQFAMLEEDKGLHPTILNIGKKHHFGKLYEENYKIWLKLQEQTGVEFDLLYDPTGWRTLIDHKELFDKPILYVHQGGVFGNESMLLRYQRRYPDITK